MDLSYNLFEAACFNVSSRALFTLPDDILEDTPHAHQSLKACFSNNYFYDSPKELEDLPFVEHVDLSHNLLNSLLQFPKLNFLKYLNLSYNDLESFEKVLEIPSLVALDVSYNKLTHIPAKISNLKNLTEVNFEGNLIDEIHSNFTQLSFLKMANFSRNKIKCLPQNMHHLTNLKILNISVNSISELPTELGKIHFLEVLEASQNPLTFPPSNITILGSSYIKAFLNLESEKFNKMTPLKPQNPNQGKESTETRKRNISLPPPIPRTESQNALIKKLWGTISKMADIRIPPNANFFEFLSDGVALCKIVEKYGGVRDFRFYIPEDDELDLSHEQKRNNIEKFIKFCDEKISSKVNVCKTFHILSGIQDDDVLRTIEAFLDYLNMVSDL